MYEVHDNDMYNYRDVTSLMSGVLWCRGSMGGYYRGFMVYNSLIALI